MQTGLYTHEECLKHVPPMGHAEKPERLKVIIEMLQESAFANLFWRNASLAPREYLEFLHDPEYVDYILNIFNQEKYKNNETIGLDPDTFMSQGTINAALRAVGAVCDAVDGVMKGDIKNAFCAVRPPGHHAESGRAMGFCIFNSVAIAARYLQRKYGIARVAIIDFDVHHGNGTQEAALNYEGIFYASIHQKEIFPLTIRPDKTVEGRTLNIPIKEKSNSEAFRTAFFENIVPKTIEFRPEFILISAGFDGHYQDPLAGLELRNDDYVWVTDTIMDIADEYCDGRVVSSLEGGYNVANLGESVLCHVSALMR